jgi:site-specific DNA-cytosine methylase
MKKLVIWALFDSGNGCYRQAVEKYFSDVFEIYSIGLDKEAKHTHFISLNLADTSELFGNSQLFETLDTLPAPTILLASPPCESWSNATNIKDGSIYWKRPVTRNLFGETRTHDFALVTKREFYTKTQHWISNPNYVRVLFSRVNGELCAVNTSRIIERYQPKIFVIENPSYGKLWRYYQHVLNFSGIKNIVCYNDYDENFSQKPTCFYSNVDLHLKVAQYRQSAFTISNSKKARARHQKVISGYNNRSNIPLSLIKEILEHCLFYLN